ncbi:DUF590 family protein [Pelomyxa schiedti]|nr:DUF590 family protein [Pelomyxa schiedti]
MSGDPYAVDDEEPKSAKPPKTMQEFEVASSEPEKALSLFCDLKDIEDRYGVGTFLYFDFLRFLMLGNLLITCAVMANWIPHVIERHDILGDNLEILFVSGYSDNLLWVWEVTSVVAFLLAAIFGFLYIIRIRNIHKRSYQEVESYEKNSLWEFDLMSQSPEEMGFIEKNMRVNSCSKFFRTLLSYFLFIIWTALSALVLIIMVVVQLRNAPITTYVYEETIEYYTISITVWDYVISVSLFVLCFIGKKVCAMLTHLERHKRRLTHSKHKTFKNFTYKVVLVSAVYWAQWLRLSDTDNLCPMRTSGIKFLSLAMTDLTVGNLLLMASPITRYLINACKGKAGKTTKPIYFDLSSQYMDVLFRQYIMYLGMTVFPGLCVISLLTTAIVYPMDKFRLVKLSANNKKSIGSMRYYLAVLMFVTAVLGFVMFPNGGGWTLVGFPGNAYCHCTIFGPTCNSTSSSA